MRKREGWGHGTRSSVCFSIFVLIYFFILLNFKRFLLKKIIRVFLVKKKFGEVIFIREL